MKAGQPAAAAPLHAPPSSYAHGLRTSAHRENVRPGKVQLRRRQLSKELLPPRRPQVSQARATGTLTRVVGAVSFGQGLLGRVPCAKSTVRLPALTFKHIIALHHQYGTGELGG